MFAHNLGSGKTCTRQVTNDTSTFGSITEENQCTTRELQAFKQEWCIIHLPAASGQKLTIRRVSPEILKSTYTRVSRI